jgi:hypothetical protein
MDEQGKALGTKTKAGSKATLEAAKGDFGKNKSEAEGVIAELSSPDKELAYRALRGDNAAAQTLAATLPT